MSFLLGSVSGALVAGGVYYGFSALMTTRTNTHRTDLHILSTRMTDASALISAPMPAVDRIEHRPFATLMKSQWNAQVESLFRSVGDLGDKAAGWTKRTLYGGYVESKKN